MGKNQDDFETHDRELSEGLRILSRIADATNDKGARIYAVLSSDNEEAMNTLLGGMQGTSLVGTLKHIFREAKSNEKLREHLEQCANDRAKISAEFKYAKKLAMTYQHRIEGDNKGKGR